MTTCMHHMYHKYVCVTYVYVGVGVVVKLWGQRRCVSSVVKMKTAGVHFFVQSLFELYILGGIPRP